MTANRITFLIATLSLLSAGASAQLAHPVAAVQNPHGSTFTLTKEGTIFAINANLNSAVVTGRFSFPVIGYLADLSIGEVKGETTLFVVSTSFVNNSAMGRIQLFSTSGLVLKTSFIHHSVSGIAFDSTTQQLYISSGDSPEIYSMSADGSQSPKFFVEISGAHKLGALAIDGERRMLYVADTDGGTISALNLATKKATPLGTVGRPQALAVVADGSSLLIADGDRKQISALDLSGVQRVRQLTPKGIFKSPTGLTWWDSSHFLVADQESGTVSFVDITGKILTSTQLRMNQ